VWRFDRQRRAVVAAEPRDRVAISEAALGIWRGTPYADCADTAIVPAEVARLLETRLTLIEARAEALLELSHAQVAERGVVGVRGDGLQPLAVLRAFRQAGASAPEELSLWYCTYQFPPLPQVPEAIRGKAFAAVAAAYLGPAEEAERLLQPLRAVPGPALDLMGPVPMEDLGRITEEPIDPTPTMEHSMFLDDLGDQVIDRLTEVAGAGSGSPLTVLQIRQLGGAFARRQPGDGACGHIEEPYVLFAMGVPAAPGLAEKLADTFGRLDQAVTGHSNGRTVPNFLGPGDDLDRVWTPQTRRRLAEIKQAVDPMSTIVSNRPVQG